MRRGLLIEVVVPMLALKALAVAQEAQQQQPVRRADGGASGAKQVFTATDLSISEPEPSYFQIPTDYKVVDRREEENQQTNR